MADCSLRPHVHWAQRHRELYLRVELSDVKVPVSVPGGGDGAGLRDSPSRTGADARTPPCPAAGTGDKGAGWGRGSGRAGGPWVASRGCFHRAGAKASPRRGTGVAAPLRPLGPLFADRCRSAGRRREGRGLSAVGVLEPPP